MNLPIATPDDTMMALFCYAKNRGVLINDNKVSITTSCYQCKHSRQVPGSAHLLCGNPSPHNTFASHGVRSGWATYPLDFDPVWRTSECDNFITRSNSLT